MRKLTSLSEFYKSDIGKGFALKISQIISGDIDYQNANVLALGFCEPILDVLYFKRLYCAIPNGYPLFHWPKIRPFKTVIVDERRMPFMPETWDVIIVMHVAEFLHNNRNFLKEISRILKKTGKLILVCINKNNFNFFSKDTVSVGGVVHGKRELIDQLVGEHFAINNVSGINGEFKFWPYNFSYGLNRLNENFGEFSKIFSDLIIISASKEELSGIAAIENLDAQYDVT